MRPNPWTLIWSAEPVLDSDGFLSSVSVGILELAESDDGPVHRATVGIAGIGNGFGIEVRAGGVGGGALCERHDGRQTQGEHHGSGANDRLFFHMIFNWLGESIRPCAAHILVTLRERAESLFMGMAGGMPRKSRDTRCAATASTYRYLQLKDAATFPYVLRERRAMCQS